jgi:hypothetical protein
MNASIAHTQMRQLLCLLLSLLYSVSDIDAALAQQRYQAIALSF